MYKRDKRINGERAWHLSSGCVSPGPSACVSQGVWDCLVMNNMNTIPGPSSHMNTTNGRTMNTLPVTGDQVGDYLWNQFRVTEFSGTKMEWTLDFIHISVAFILLFLLLSGQRWAAGRHKTYNGIPFQLTEPTTLFSFQATSFLRSLSSGGASNETKTNKKGMLPNSTFNLCLALDFLKWLSEIVSCHGYHLDHCVTVISGHF